MDLDDASIDSRTILGEQGAEHLLGQGDMLYMASGGRVMRVHGPFVSDEEIEGVTGFLKEKSRPQYVDINDVDIDDASPGESGSSSGSEDVYQQAVAIVMRDRKTSHTVYGGLHRVAWVGRGVVFFW